MNLRSYQVLMISMKSSSGNQKSRTLEAYREDRRPDVDLHKEYILVRPFDCTSRLSEKEIRYDPEYDMLAWLHTINISPGRINRDFSRLGMGVLNSSHSQCL